RLGRQRPDLLTCRYDLDRPPRQRFGQLTLRGGAGLGPEAEPVGVAGITVDAHRHEPGKERGRGGAVAGDEQMLLAADADDRRDGGLWQIAAEGIQRQGAAGTVGDRTAD